MWKIFCVFFDVFWVFSCSTVRFWRCRKWTSFRKSRQKWISLPPVEVVLLTFILDNPLIKTVLLKYVYFLLVTLYTNLNNPFSIQTPWQCSHVFMGLTVDSLTRGSHHWESPLVLRNTKSYRIRSSSVPEVLRYCRGGRLRHYRCRLAMDWVTRDEGSEGSLRFDVRHGRRGSRPRNLKQKHQFLKVHNTPRLVQKDLSFHS